MSKIDDNTKNSPDIYSDSVEDIELLKKNKFNLMKCINCQQYFLFEGGCYSIKCIFCSKHFCSLCNLIFEGKYQYLHFPNGPLENCLNIKN